jgi:Fe-S cluster biogenesis protein NfuA
MLPEPIHDALIAITRRLSKAGVPFYVGGSTMLRLAGFDVTVRDIDLVVAGSHRSTVPALFHGIEDVESKEPWQSAWLLRGSEGDGEAALGIDVIGDLRLRIDGAIASFPLEAAVSTTVGGVTVPVGPLHHWYHLYRIHAPHKAQLIASRLTDEEIIRGAGELGIGEVFSPTLIVRIGNETPNNTIEEVMSTEPQSSIIEVASPTDVSFDEPGSEAIDHDLLNETLEYIRPALQADGGDLVLLGTAGGKVTLQMVGACGGCPLSTMTLTAGIERIVKDRVPGVTEVVSV